MFSCLFICEFLVLSLLWIDKNLTMSYVYMYLLDEPQFTIADCNSLEKNFLDFVVSVGDCLLVKLPLSNLILVSLVCVKHL